MSVRFKPGVIFKLLLWFVLLTSLAATFIAWVAAGRLLHPVRRQLQDYQQEWLTHPAAHGMKVHARFCAGGKIPCLFAAPDGRAGVKQRGKILRGQLAAASLALRPYGETQGILVLLHGRGGRKEDLLPIAERFVAAGFNCVIPDLPAHGDNTLQAAHFSTSSFERGIADKVLADARVYFGERDSPAGIWGISMGGAFAIHAVSQSPEKWKAVVIVASFDSLESVVEDTLAFLPKPLSATLEYSLETMVRYRGDLVLDAVQPAAWARRITTPVLMAHGDRDQVVAMQRGKHLFDALRSKNKVWMVVPGANHRNVLITDAPLYARMSAWFIRFMR